MCVWLKLGSLQGIIISQPYKRPGIPGKNLQRTNLLPAFSQMMQLSTANQMVEKSSPFCGDEGTFFFPVRPVGQACGSEAFLKPKSKWNHLNIFKPCYPAWSTIYFHEPTTQLGNPPKDALSFLQEFKHFGGEVERFWETLMPSLCAGWYIGSLILAYYCPIVIAM